MHISRVWPILFFQDASLIEDNVMSFVDSSAEIEFSYRPRHHFCMFVAGKVGSGTDDTVVDIAFIMKDSASSRSSSDKLHVFPRETGRFTTYLLSIAQGARLLK